MNGLGHELYYNKCSQNFKIDRPDQIKTEGERQKREERDIEKNIILFKNEYQNNNIIQVLPYNGLFFEDTYNKFITNYKIRDFGGGGDCLFHAIAGVLNLKYDLSGADTLDHIFVRNEIVNKMQEIHNDKDMGKYQLVRSQMKSIKNMQEYIEKMRIHSTGENGGTWGEDLEIAIATLVDFRKNETEGTPIRVNIHVLQKNGDNIKEATNGTDVDINSNERSFTQSFIQKDNQTGIIIYNNGKPDVVESGTHYQGVIPQHGKKWNNGKVPFIYWNFLDSEEELLSGSGKKRKKGKKRKQKKTKKRNTKKKTKKRKLNI